MAQINPRGSLYSIGVKCITHRFYFRTTNYRRRTTWLTYLDDRNVRGDGGGEERKKRIKRVDTRNRSHHLLFSLVFAFNPSIPRDIIYNTYIYIYMYVEYYFESITFDVKYNTIRIKTCMETKYLSIKQGKKIKMFLCRI